MSTKSAEDILMERSAGAMAIAEADEGWERAQIEARARVDTYTLEEALSLARLWRAGKLIGGDQEAVIDVLLTEIERLQAG